MQAYTQAIGDYVLANGLPLAWQLVTIEGSVHLLAGRHGQAGTWQPARLISILTDWSLPW